MKLLILTFSLLGSIVCLSQEKDSIQVDVVFADPEEPASFPEGLQGWAKYLRKNLKYPKQAQRMGIQGQVILEFIVEKNGELSDIKIVKGVGAGCDEEAHRMLKEGPKWLPGKINDEAVRQKMMMSIAFRLK